MNVLRLIGICALALAFSGCLGRLIADKGMTDDDARECAALVEPIKARFGLEDFRLYGLVPDDQPATIACSTHVGGVLLTLYTRVEVWRVLDEQRQTAIITAIREERRRLAHPKPTLVSFWDLWPRTQARLLRESTIR